MTPSASDGPPLLSLPHSWTLLLPVPETEKGLKARRSPGGYTKSLCSLSSEIALSCRLFFIFYFHGNQSVSRPVMESKLLFIYFYWHWQESRHIFQAGETPLPNEKFQWMLLGYRGPRQGMPVPNRSHWCCRLSPCFSGCVPPSW